MNDNNALNNLDVKLKLLLLISLNKCFAYEEF